MKLWIRSQDKELLIQTKCFEIEYFGESAFTHINTRFEDKNVSLGCYRTKERALEVLDEIQNKLSKTNDSYKDLIKKLEIFNETPIISCNNNDDCTISLNIIMLKEMVIYEMPKE